MCEWETWKRNQPTDEGFYKVIWKRTDTENIFETELAWDAACKCWRGIEFQPEWSENYEIIAWQKTESEPENNGLKPCPFCGGEAEIVKDYSTFSELYYKAQCKRCSASVIVYADATRTDEYNETEVAEKWNNRPNPWHTGTPTEDGEYLVICQYVIDNYYYREKLVWEFENGDWKNKQRLTENYCIKELKILAWYEQKIEPYKEATK